jgi:hypothetical protein
MYTVSRKNGSFPGGKRTLRFFTYDEMRVFLRSYCRRTLKLSFPRSTHPPITLIASAMQLTIKKEV